MPEVARVGAAAVFEQIVSPSRMTTERNRIGFVQHLSKCLTEN